MNTNEVLPLYRRDGGIAHYERYLPRFRGQSLIQLIDGLVSQQGSVSILDLGSGEFVFAEECHQRWPGGQARVTGVSLHDFLDTTRKALLESKGISLVFAEIAQVPKLIKPDYDLVVSVLSSIYTSDGDYPTVMWGMLKSGSVGLLDNLPAGREGVGWAELERKLQSLGYEVTFDIRHIPIEGSKYGPLAPQTPTVPDMARVYARELVYLQRQQDATPKAIQTPDVSLAFLKNEVLPNIGQTIAEIISVGRA